MTDLLGDDRTPSMLAVIVEANPLAMSQREQRPETEHLIDGNELIGTLSLFCHSYSLMHRLNRVLVMANHPNAATILYPRRGSTNGKALADDYIPVSHILQSAVSSGLRNLMSNEAVESSSDATTSSSLAQALSAALCVINRQLQIHSNLQPRILVVQVSKDVSETYNSIMNSIFSAQKLGVIVDAVVLAKDDSRFLQQACLLTGGVYQRPVNQKYLLQLMLTHNLPSGYTRKILNEPVQKSVDFRASCFCHKKPVDFAFMCSVCLALTCDPPSALNPSCSTCGTPMRVGGAQGRI